MERLSGIACLALIIDFKTPLNSGLGSGALAIHPGSITAFHRADTGDHSLPRKHLTMLAAFPQSGIAAWGRAGR